MKKLFTFMVLGAAVVLSSCAKTDFDKKDGKEVEVTINANVQSASATRSGVTMPQNCQLRYVLEVYSADGTKWLMRKTMLSPTYSSFSTTVRLVIDNDYQFVMWADFVSDACNDPDLVTDNVFYNTSSLKNITLTTDPAAVKLNDPSRDAFFACKTKTVTSNSNLDLELKRPFAQIRVMTTDMELARECSLEPTRVSIDYSKNSGFFTAFDASTGKASVPVTGPVCVAVPIGEAPYPSTTLPQDVTAWDGLSFDYLLADATSNNNVDFVLKCETPSKTITRNISNIPIAQNTRTTVYGDLLTGDATLNISINPGFGGDNPVSISYVDNLLIPGNITSTPPDPFVIPDNTMTPKYTFYFQGAISSDVTITLADETPNNSLTDYSGDVYLIFDQTPPADLTLNLDLPFATVHLNGLVINSGTINATVSDHTLLIDGACKIGTLNLNKGNVEIGSVATGTAAVVGTINHAPGCKVFWGVRTPAEMCTKAAAGSSALNNDGVFLLNDMIGLTQADGSSALAIGGYNNATSRAGYIFDGKGHTLSGAVVPPTGSTTSQSVMHVYANNVIVRNVTMTNTAGNGMTIYYCSGVRLENVTILNCNNPASPANSQVGIGLIVNNSPGVTITGCDIENNKSGGVNVDGKTSTFDFSDGTNVIKASIGKYVYTSNSAPAANVSAPAGWKSTGGVLTGYTFTPPTN